MKNEWEMTDEELNEMLAQEQAEIEAEEMQRRYDELRMENYDFEYGDVRY